MMTATREHNVNLVTGRCVMCGRNRFQRRNAPICDYGARIAQRLADSDSDTERDADYDIEQERIKFQKELGAAMVKAGAREIELPRITYHCPNCGQVDSHTDECPSNPQRYEHDTPAAPERGEWRYVETRYSAEVAVNDNLRLRAHWTGTWDRDEIRTLMQGVVTEHNQHSTLIAQRERLLRLLRPVTSPTACYCAVMKSGKCWHCEARELITTIEQDQITSRTTSEQEESAQR